eukprot:GGOE01008908.1.p2 GENE.GGOE01008908.1~~GGOE01008908.1.p2  ORF type:complete len:101 (-),score=0.02 GGOE01008908.1:238-540(-)
MTNQENGGRGREITVEDGHAVRQGTCKPGGGAERPQPTGRRVRDGGLVGGFGRRQLARGGALLHRRLGVAKPGRLLALKDARPSAVVLLKISRNMRANCS